MEEAGKGDKRRPKEITQEQLDANWDAIFGKKEEPDMNETDKQPQDNGDIIQR